MTTTDHLSAAAEFKRLQSEATGEFWERYGNIGHSGGLRMVRCEIERDRTNRAVYTQIPATDKDAALICAAKHTDLPERIEQLVAEVERLRAENIALGWERDGLLDRMNEFSEKETT